VDEWPLLGGPSLLLRARINQAAAARSLPASGRDCLPAFGGRNLTSLPGKQMMMILVTAADRKQRKKAREAQEKVACANSHRKFLSKTWGKKLGKI